jgi:uncharacterized protein YkwD
MLAVANPARLPAVLLAVILCQAPGAAQPPAAPQGTASLPQAAAAQAPAVTQPQAAAPPPPGAAQPPAAPDLPHLRERLAAAINAERRAAGVPELRPLPSLDAVAQRRAEEIGSRGELPDESEAMALFGRIQVQMVRAGYLPHLWTESVSAMAGDPEAIVAFWKTSPDLAPAMRREMSGLGIGISRFRGVPLYVFLFAWPEEDAWQRQAEPLRDLGRLRAALLAAVNAARHAAGRQPLAADPRLDAAAQAHAEDMLARSYYAHRGPDGSTPRERVEAAGYEASTVAENIAARHLGADEAIAGWMASSEHRHNLLDPRFTDLGSGVAVGGFDHRYQVLWVLDLARRRP